MAKRENVLPYAPIGALIQEASGKRVSRDAKKVSAQILEDVTQRIIYKAKLIAEHSNRKTIKAKDIMLAYNQEKGNL